MTYDDLSLLKAIERLESGKREIKEAFGYSLVRKTDTKEDFKQVFFFLNQINSKITKIIRSINKNEKLEW